LAKKVGTVVVCVALIAVSVYFALPSYRPPKINPDDYRRPWVCEACGHTFMEPPTAGVLPCPKCGAEFEAFRYKDYYGVGPAHDEGGEPMPPLPHYKRPGGEWVTNRDELGDIKCPKCGNADPATLKEKVFAPGSGGGR